MYFEEKSLKYCMQLLRAVVAEPLLNMNYCLIVVVKEKFYMSYSLHRKKDIGIHKFLTAFYL